MINEIINQIDKNKVKKRFDELFVKSCTEELSIQEQREKDKLEKVIIALKIKEVEK